MSDDERVAGSRVPQGEKVHDEFAMKSKNATKHDSPSLTEALSDCLDIIEPLREELFQQGRWDAAKCCDEVIAFSRQALGAGSRVPSPPAADDDVSKCAICGWPVVEEMNDRERRFFVAFTWTGVIRS